MTHILLADIGGTHARFALGSGSVLGPVRSLEVHAHPTVADAIRTFLKDSGGAPIDGAILAIAGPIVEGRCVLTNSQWTVDAADLKREFGFRTVRLLNDLEAVALSLAHLAPADTHLIGQDTAIVGTPLAVLSPGTGLGMACLLPGDDARAIASEGGHATLAATTAREDALIAILRRQFGHVSAERVLSGDGLVNLYNAIAAADRIDPVPRTAPEVTKAALDGSSVACREALDIFCAMLGSVAGDMALFFGARGGIFIGGGIVPQIAHYLGRTDFHRRFNAKGRFQPYLAAIPIRVILRPEPAFLGLSALIQKENGRLAGRPQVA